MRLTLVPISSKVNRIPLRVLLLFSLIFMFMAAHVYITSQPVNSVVMAEILEEHEEDANHFLVDAGDDLANPILTEILDFVEAERGLSPIFLHLTVRSGALSEDPPPPRF
ncbi:hypothetical protein [Halocola ammonii]